MWPTVGLVCVIFFVAIVLPSLFDGGDPALPENRALLKQAQERREAKRDSLRAWLHGAPAKAP